MHAVSYLVLARKWRPQTFSDLIGQEHVSRTLKNAIDSGRVAHAFLFTGARGVGKTSSARILAKALNCEEGMSPEPCNVCPACREITDGTSVDVFEIDGASNNGVDEIRELRETIKYLPSRCRYKIFIIDEVHMLSTSAFNALLKTLEEPPPHVKFIFATTEPHKVPITILSRCQRFDFKRIPLQRIAARLRYIVDQEGVAISDASLAVVARKGDGSMRDAISTLDQVLAFCGQSAADEDVVALLGVVDRRLLMETSAAVFARDTREVLETVRRVDSFGYNMRQFCQELIEHFRGFTIIRAVGRDADDILDLSEGEMAELHRQAGEHDLPTLQRYLTLLLKAEGEMAGSGFPRLVMEMALLKMATLPPVVPVEEILARLAALEGVIPAGAVASAPPVWNAPARNESASRPAPQPAGQAPRQQAPQGRTEDPPPRTTLAAASPEPAGPRDWPGFVAYVKGKKPMFASVLEKGRPLSVTEERLEIGFAGGSFEFARMQDKETLEELVRLGGEFFPRKPEVRIVSLAGDAPDLPPSLHEKKSLDNARRMSEIRSKAEGHPMVAASLRIFGGTLEGVREKGPGKGPARQGS